MSTILVIDDDPDILEALGMALEDGGYEVVTSDKGEYVENLKQVDGKWPAMIILDVLLSGKDGRIICKKLKSRKEMSLIPILMISAHPTARASVLEAGADEFLAKPFRIEALLGVVEKYVGR